VKLSNPIFKTTLETSGEQAKTTLETSEEDDPAAQAVAIKDMLKSLKRKTEIQENPPSEGTNSKIFQTKNEITLATKTEKEKIPVTSKQLDDYDLIIKNSKNIKRKISEFAEEKEKQQISEKEQDLEEDEEVLGDDWFQGPGLRFAVDSAKAYKLDIERAERTLETYDPLDPKSVEKAQLNTKREVKNLSSSNNKWERGAVAAGDVGSSRGKGKVWSSTTAPSGPKELAKRVF
jgi:hypothetical protein